MSKAIVRFVGLLVLLSLSMIPVRAQLPASDAEVAARELINTMKTDDQFRAMLPMILKSMKPATSNATMTPWRQS